MKRLPNLMLMFRSRVSARRTKKTALVSEAKLHGRTFRQVVVRVAGQHDPLGSPNHRDQPNLHLASGMSSVTLPPGLVAGTDAGTVVAVKIFVGKHIIAPFGIRLKLFSGTENRARSISTHLSEIFELSY